MQLGGRSLVAGYAEAASTDRNCVALDRAAPARFRMKIGITFTAAVHSYTPPTFPSSWFSQY
jgi:hypothetical protein